MNEAFSVNPIHLTQLRCVRPLSNHSTKKYVMSKSLSDERKRFVKAQASNARFLMNKFKHILDFLGEESLEFKPVHQLRDQGAA